MTKVRKIKPWKQFEQFVAAIQKQLTPDAEVKHNDHIVGKSGVSRQIDVAIRYNLGQFKMLIVLDCKDWRNPVDIKDVGAFCDSIEDIGANKGAMVCNAGFTSGAKKRAAEKGVALFAAIDVESVEWPVNMAFPTICRFRGVKNFRIKFTSRQPLAIPRVDVRQLEIYRKDGSLIDLLGNLHLAAWYEGRLPSEPGEYKNVKFLQEEAYTKFKDQLYGPVEITTTVTIQERLFFGELPLSEARGFRDEQSGSFTTNSITTGLLDMVEVENGWRRLENLNELSVKPVLTLFALDCYPAIKLPPK